MSNSIKQIRITGLYDRFNLSQEFFPGINILYGINGGLKTTILHILVNALNGDFDRFAFLNFNFIQIILDNGREVVISRRREIDEFSKKSDFIVTVSFDNYIERISSDEIESLEPSLNPKINDNRRHSRENHKSVILLETAYIPAYRLAIDAWKSTTKVKNDIDSEITLLARKWLIPFIPKFSKSQIQAKHRSGWT